MPVEFISFSSVNASLSAVFLPFSAVPILFSADLNSSLPYLDVDPSSLGVRVNKNKTKNLPINRDLTCQQGLLMISKNSRKFDDLVKSLNST